MWREALLAQAVLTGSTNGYVHHPQLLRFREQSLPIAFIAEYLRSVHREAVNRGYRFDVEKIIPLRAPSRLTVTRGQLEFERRHLMKKLERRDPKRLAPLRRMESLEPHPLFRMVRGSIARWEKVAI